MKINSKIKDLKLVFTNMEKEEYFYFTYSDKKSEKIICSSLLDSLKVVKNKTKEYLNYYIDDDFNDYGRVESIVFEDKKNLTYKKDFKKQVHIYYPSGFNKDKKYGVIYMFDSDNLFDLKKVGKYTTDPDNYGSWQIESTLIKLKEKYSLDFIVIGISSKEGVRDTELTMHKSYQEFQKGFPEIDEYDFQNGKLDNLGDFIKFTLMPYVNDKFNIDNNLIGICGASSGGLASFYLGLRDLGLYKFILTLSPANAIFTDKTWIKFYEEIDLKNNLDKTPYIFFYQGSKDKLEELLCLGNLNIFNNLFKLDYPKDKTYSYINTDFRHNEIAWRLAFNKGMDEVYLFLSRNKLI